MAPINFDCGNPACKEKLPKTGDYAVCSTCTKGLHLETCSGLKKRTWSSMGSVAQASWVCTYCRRDRKGSSSKIPEAELLEEAEAEDYEVSSLGVQKAILAKVNTLMDVKSKIESIDASMKFLAEKYDALLVEVSGLRAENKSLKDEVSHLKSDQISNRTMIKNLSMEITELNQYGRRLNLEIQGLPVKGDIRTENLASELEAVAQAIGVEYEPSLIHQAHRLQPRTNGQPPTVIVQFFSKVTRDLWIHNGRRAKLTRGNNKVFFNENLCPQNRHLLKEAKARANAHRYCFVWFSGGQIRVKKDENTKSIIVVKSHEDLNKIR